MVYIIFSLYQRYLTGVLGAWLCGMISMVGELYGAESKTQVYGQLHTLLSRNSEAMKQLGIIVVYKYHDIVLFN